MKLIVETPGKYQLVGAGPEQFCSAFRPSVVATTHFIQASVAANRLKVLFQVADTAKDADLQAWLKDDKKVEDFAAEHALDKPAADAKPAPKAK